MFHSNIKCTSIFSFDFRVTSDRGLSITYFDLYTISTISYEYYDRCTLDRTRRRCRIYEVVVFHFSNKPLCGMIVNQNAVFDETSGSYRTFGVCRVRHFRLCRPITLSLSLSLTLKSFYTHTQMYIIYLNKYNAE